MRRYVWERDYTADEYISLLDTFSGHIAMDPAKREHVHREIRRRLAQRPDGRVHRHWYAILHVARKLEQTDHASEWRARLARSDIGRLERCRKLLAVRDG